MQIAINFVIFFISQYVQTIIIAIIEEIIFKRKK